MQNDLNDIRVDILNRTKEYIKATHIMHSKNTKINYAGRVYDEEEVCNLVDAALEFWLTAGRHTKQFESELADFLGVRFCSFVNSKSLK